MLQIAAPNGLTGQVTAQTTDSAGQVSNLATIAVS
jgi:hypothetical protein